MYQFICVSHIIAVVFALVDHLVDKNVPEQLHCDQHNVLQFQIMTSYIQRAPLVFVENLGSILILMENLVVIDHGNLLPSDTTSPVH